MHRFISASPRAVLAAVMVAVATCSLTATTYGAESVILPQIDHDAPRLTSLRTVVSDGAGGGYTVDLRFSYDHRGRLRNGGSCLADGQVVKVRGKVKRTDAGWFYKFKLKTPKELLGDDVWPPIEPLKVVLSGLVTDDQPDVTVKYRGPRGALEPTVADVTLVYDYVATRMRLSAAAGATGDMIGSGVFRRGFRGRGDAVLKKARLVGDRLQFTLKREKDKVRFTGVMQADGTAVGSLRFKLMPEKGRRAAYVVPPLSGLNAPDVASIVFAPGTNGDVPVTVRHSGGDGGPVTLAVEVSRDSLNTWHDARLTDIDDNVLAAGPGGETTFLWDSVADVGFHEPRSVHLRVSAIENSACGEPRIESSHVIDNLRVVSANVYYQMVHYGELPPAAIAVAERHELAIVHPFAGDLRREQIAEIQDGVDPDDPADDVLVLGYISIGEDLRTDGISEEEMLLDPRFTGDGTGPRVDPRGPGLEGGSLRDLPILGSPSPLGSGYASYYMDDTYPDGKPDKNPIFGSAFVNAGDPAWFDTVEHMTFETDGMPGFLETLTTDVGRGLGCNGVFMDTWDTPAPNVFTHPDFTENPTDYEWTGPGFAAFARRLRAAHPRTLLLQNRGMFFYDPRYPHFEHHAGDAIDYLFFESYRTDNNKDSDVVVSFYLDNRYNAAPKLMAEANRENGFTVVSLGYAEGPPDVVRQETLVGLSTIGMGTLLQDIKETHEIGFRHYLGNLEVNLPNMFVMNHETFEDHRPPVWNSTYNANPGDWPTPPPEAPTPRVGIQQAAPGKTDVVVRWDVAMDMHRVSYTCYYQEEPFDFTRPDPLADATRHELELNVGAGYALGPAPATYPYEDVLEDMTPGVEYFFLIRATDASPSRNQELNTVVLSAIPVGDTYANITLDGDYSDWAGIRPAHTDFADVPDSSGPDWREIYLANDEDFLYVRVKSDNVFDVGEHFLAYIDADDDPGTGLTDPADGIVGSDILVFANQLYRQITNFNDGFLQTFDTSPLYDVTQAELAIPLSQIRAIRPDATQIRIRFHNDAVKDYAPNGSALHYVLETGP